MKFNIVVAVDRNRGIGKDNSLPWRLPGDLKHFKQITSRAAEGKRNAVVMGRRTWESLPAKSRPLPGRLNIIVSRQPDLVLPEDCILAASLDDALQYCDSCDDLFDVFVIGGARLYAAALPHRMLKKVYLTEIQDDFQCDCFFPEYEQTLRALPGLEEHSDNGIDYSFKILVASQTLEQCGVE